MKRAFYYGIFLMLLISGCDKRLSHMEDSYLAKESIYSSCENDDDCATIKKGCCSCNQGGEQRAVAKKYSNELQAELSEKCSQTMCMQMISNHPSCQKKVYCVDRQCVLQ